jgi:DNA-binding winged helix-turn-helix (wHTH) protein
MNIDQAARTPIEHEAANPDWRFSGRPRGTIRARPFTSGSSAFCRARASCYLTAVPSLWAVAPLISCSCLVQARGTVVTKEVIARQVWPSTIVEESNLRFQMACLRKALGVDRDLIKTVPGRGYLLAADVDEQSLQVPQSSGARACHRLRSRSSAPVQRPSRSPEVRSRQADARAVEEDEPMRERVQALLRLAGLQVQLFGSVGAFLSDARGAA